jgi:hypothetical protein
MVKLWQGGQFMKMTLSLPEAITNEIAEISKATGYTKSGLVLTALNIYFLLYHADNQKAKQLAQLIPENQSTIYDFLKTKQSGSKAPVAKRAR